MSNVLRFKDLQARGIVTNRVQLKHLQTKHRFPVGFLLGEYSRGFLEHEVEAWLKDRPRPTKMVAKRLRGLAEDADLRGRHNKGNKAKRADQSVEA